MFRKTVAALCALLLILAAPASYAQSRGLTLVRDAELEASIRTMLSPIFAAAGLSADSVRVHFVQDDSLNAFVAGGQAIYIHTGLILRVRNVGELLGVLAHEAGHVAGGHLVRGADQVERAMTTAVVGTLLGAAAMASGFGSAGAVALFGGAGIGQQSLLAYTRSMESAADQAGVRFLERAGIPPDGALTLLEYQADQELGFGRPTAYASTHPLASDRLEALRRTVESSPLYRAPMPAGWDALFERMQAKLYGFVRPQQAASRYPASDMSLPAQYARAIAAYRLGLLPEALTRMEALLAAAPNDPFFHELMGQMLLESGRIAEARGYYERALALRPDETLFLIPLAQTKIDAGDLAGAISDLERAARSRTPPSITFRLLATAYGMQGDVGTAASYLAEEAMRRGDHAGAAAQAERAMQLLGTGSPGWLRAQDILNALRTTN